MVSSKKLGEASHALGYAIGVMEGLADMVEGLNDRQKDCLDTAIAQLRKVDLCELAGLSGEENQRG